MRKIVTSLLGVALCSALASSAFAANAVRISQVYGGGGGASGTYMFDYVELFNNSGSAVAIGGWSVQYGSATGSSFGSTAGNMAVIPAGTVIGACKYYLLQVGSAGTGGAALPVTPDLVSAGPSMAAASGKVALITNSTGNNACSGNTSGAIYSDVVGYGTGAGMCFETAATPVTSNVTTAVRNNGGVTDTDNNSADFTITSSPSVTIHNSSSAANTACLATPNSARTWGAVKQMYR